jgi:hypothetical protein
VSTCILERGGRATADVPERLPFVADDLPDGDGFTIRKRGGYLQQSNVKNACMYMEPRKQR